MKGGIKVSDFDRRVYEACRRIPKGRVSTYGSLAKAIGSCPRAVGGALRRNPFAPEVPCHRVVASDRSLGGFNGVWEAEAPELARKRKLLVSEGVQFHGPKARVAERCMYALDAPEASPVDAQQDMQQIAKKPKRHATAGSACSPAGHRIVGIDWSGARNAGLLIHVAVGTLAPALDGDGLLWALNLESVRPAAALRTGDAARSLEGATTAVVEELLGFAQPRTLTTVGVDAPLSLPRSLVRAAVADARGRGLGEELVHGAVGEQEQAEWLALCRAAPTLWPNADSLRDWSAAATERALQDDTQARAGRVRELKRSCDVDAQAPFAPTNLRLYRQTHSAITLLCLPLLQRAESIACVVPMMDDADHGSKVPLRLLEACPASLLKRHGVCESYKGTGAAHAAARSRLVSRARSSGFEVGGSAPAGRIAVRVECSDALAAELMAQTGGDALDAVLAAIGTACSVLRPDFPAPIEGTRREHRIEGAIYS